MRSTAAGSSQRRTGKTVSKPTGTKGTLSTIIFIDWDDTMLASSVLVTHGVTLTSPIVPQEIIQQFEPLQDQVIKFIKTAFTFTKNIYVITNAERGWVELSAEKFMPRVAAWVPKLNVFSARTTFQDSFPSQPDAWKKTAFLDRISHCFQKATRDRHGPQNLNVISIGDSECERTALLQIKDSCAPTAYLKSIKLVEQPSTEQLRRELEMIQNNFEFIINHAGSLDLMLQISTLPQSSQPAKTADSSTTSPTQSTSTSKAPAPPPPVTPPSDDSSSSTTPTNSRTSSTSSTSKDDTSRSKQTARHQPPPPPPPPPRQAVISPPVPISHTNAAHPPPPLPILPHSGRSSFSDKPYNSPDGHLTEEMRKKFEERQLKEAAQKK